MSATFVALLRAVNVGGGNRVPMAELKLACESLKFEEPTTYLQSGNVVFRCADIEALEVGRRLEKAIEARFGSQIPVLIRSRQDLEAIIRQNPFAGRKGIDGSRLAVVFLSSAPEGTLWEQLCAPAYSPEQFHLEGREIFVYYPNGLGRSKLTNNFFESKLKVIGTTRNWNTVERLHSLAAEIERGG